MERERRKKTKTNQRKTRNRRKGIEKTETKRKRIKPTGFTIGGNNLYLTNSDGNLIVISLSAGNVIKIEKVGRDLLSKPLIYDENLFIVKNGSITQYD